MRARLALLVAATTSVVLLAFLLPLAVSIARSAHSNAITEATAFGQSLSRSVAGTTNTPASRAELNGAIDDVRDAGFPVSVLLPGRAALGDRVDGARPNPATLRTSRVEELASGASVIRQPVFRFDGTAVVSTVVPASALRAGVARAWLVLGGLGVVLVLLSLVVADRLARSMTGPISNLAHTAERLGKGDLAARATPGGPTEIREVGLALNRLATRIDELLSREREEVADLSHRLRTPITALRLDAEGLRDVEERARLAADVDEISRQVDALIREARRPVREGVEARSDAREVVADRVTFWGALAEDQGRELRLELPEGPCEVRASRPDLEAAVDALIGNVFSHTPDGTPFRVSLRPLPTREALLVVTDEGGGFGGVDVLARGASGAGSTGLGLDIARHTAAASGGDLQLGDSPTGGARVTVRFGPPAP
jgi:signal transduction histidine kinase